MTASSARICIKNLEFQGRHGATAAERRTLRRFQVDLEMECDVARAVASDRLGDTVDYHAVCALIDEVGTSHTYHLIEALAGAILEAIAGRFPVRKCLIEVRKLNPPCPGNPAWTAVRLESR